MQGIGSRIIVLKFITTANDKLENELSSIADRGQTDRVTTLLTLSLSILIYMTLTFDHRRNIVCDDGDLSHHF